MDLNYSLVILSLLALIAKLCDGRKILKPTDTWTQQNFIFDQDAILGTDIVDEEHLIFPEDLRSDVPSARQGPIAQLLICIFRGCPPPNPLETTEGTTEATTKSSASSSSSSTTKASTTSTTKATTTTKSNGSGGSSTTSAPMTTTMASNLIPTGRRRRPIKFPMNDYCKNPPKKHVKDRFTEEKDDPQTAKDSDTESESEE